MAGNTKSRNKAREHGRKVRDKSGPGFDVEAAPLDPEQRHLLDRIARTQARHAVTDLIGPSALIK